MRDTELYRHLLSITEPWRVEKVDLNVADKRVDVHVAHDDGVRFACPECDQSCPVYDHSATRSWRHLDSCGFATFLVARPPRVECPTHGVLQAALPWAEPGSRFTALFEALAIEVLKQTSVSGAAQILGVGWDAVFGIMERAVRRGLDAKAFTVPERVGIDEKSIARRHTYLSLVYDLDEGTVEHIGDGRGLDALEDYFDAFTPEELAGVKAVAMDMWGPYISSVRAHVPDADTKIVFDPFHVIKHATDAVDKVRRATDAVDKVRRAEHRSLRAAGDDTLTGTRYLWLYGAERVPEHRREAFDELRGANLKTGRGWAIKESLRDFYTYRSRAAAGRYLSRWYYWATHSRLEPVIKVARMIRAHQQGVLNFFRHRITNAVPEAINNVILTIKKRAQGFRNRNHFKTAIFFHCGGLQLQPMTHGIAG